MKKLLAVCLAAGILTITGCSADTVAGITEKRTSFPSLMSRL